MPIGRAARLKILWVRIRIPSPVQQPISLKQSYGIMALRLILDQEILGSIPSGTSTLSCSIMAITPDSGPGDTVSITVTTTLSKKPLTLF